MGKKVCEICKERPATVPDRNRPGRLINRVCSKCHGARLAGDMKRIIAFAEQLRHEWSVPYVQLKAVGIQSEDAETPPKEQP